MSTCKTVNLLVPVTVPAGFDLEKVDLAGFLSKFIEIGLEDLQESVADGEIETSEDEELVVSQTDWGNPSYVAEEV